MILFPAASRIEQGLGVVQDQICGGSGVERARFLSAADRRTPKMRALCHLLLAYTGCRVSEALAALTIAHVDIRALDPYDQDPQAAAHHLPCRVGAAGDGRHAAGAAARHDWPLPVGASRDGGARGQSRNAPRGHWRAPRGYATASASAPLDTTFWMGHDSPMTTAIYINVAGVEERQFSSRMW